MTCIAIMSDPHANFEALGAVLADLDKFEVEDVYCTGDMIGYGPQPRETVDLLRERGVICTMGNHEQGLINIHYLRRFNQPAADALRRTREMISEETFRWLTTRPKAVTAHGCRFVHGLPPDSVNDYLWRVREDMGPVFASYVEEFCFVGHTHDLMRFADRRGKWDQLPLTMGETLLAPGRRHLVNIGAVGQPRDGDNRAKYVLFDTDTRMLTLRFVEYDIERTASLIRSIGFHRAFADRLF